MKRAFSLLELMAAVVIGAMIMLMVAGSMRSTIRAWETVQQRVSENYSRRAVLDLVKRQTSSLFFKRDADQLAQTPRFIDSTSIPGNPTPNPLDNNRRNRAPQQRDASAELPPGADFFRGNLQELSFVSTVSFLSDFPGEVAVRYYVVQGGSDEDEGEGTSTRSDSTDRDPVAFAEGEAEVAAEEIQGDLYLFVEEKNLFLSTIYARENGAGDLGGQSPPPLESDRNDDEGNQEDAGASESEVVGTSTMKLIGPLRKFTIRYRKPLKHGAEDQGDDEDWAETWDSAAMGYYPSAVEFIFVYERGQSSEDVDTEDLPGIRMVIPVYDAQNLSRGVNSGPF